MSNAFSSSGTISTTSMMRRLCAAATRSTCPPCRSARTAISLAPPIAMPKNDVGASVATILPSSQLPSTPSASAKATASATHGPRRTTSRTTSGEKYSPSATPMIHCPAWRPPGGDASRPCSMLTSATATSGPISHGSGARIQTQMSAPASATTRERRTGRTWTISGGPRAGRGRCRGPVEGRAAV